MRTLHELGPSKLQAAEQELIRNAADCLIFCADVLADAAALQALTGVEQLCRALIESGRWEQITAMRLADDVAQCGPSRILELEAA